MTLDLHFYMNAEEVRMPLPAGLLVLDFVRQHRRLTGVKEGCREGDCGACVVLLGQLDGSEVRYRSVTSCMLPVGALHGKHLVTIEGLSERGVPDDLSSVQQAIVDEGASQCGFCTPGIVMSAVATLMRPDVAMDLDEAKNVLGGHLCRCTGYRSLKAAIAGADRFEPPSYFAGMSDRLAAIKAIPQRNGQNDRPLAIAGGTDVYLQIGDGIPGRPVSVLTLDSGLHGIERKNGRLEIGAATTFEQFSHHPEVKREIPNIHRYMPLIASRQIRNTATLGGNIVNASPIGDVTILLLALGCELVLRSGRDPDQVRVVSMDDFFLGYKKLDMYDGEVLQTIHLPDTKGAGINWEKVSKRKYLDIASVNSAIRIDGPEGVVRRARIAVGGVAPVPLLLRETNAFLKNREIHPETVLAAVDVAQAEIAPISDIRGTADYKRLLTRQLIIAHFATLYPDRVTLDAVLRR